MLEESNMKESAQFSNVTGTGVLSVYGRMFARAVQLLLDSGNRAVRKERAISWGDAVFNFVKLSFLEATVLKYRYMVHFGDAVLLDSTFPPFPSRAFDKRICNYLNNLDMTQLPSGIISISTTNCCPYACAFCSTDARRNTDNDLDEELLKTTIRQVEDLGAPTIILHGGEPMFRYDRFLRLVQHVSDDICLWMFTTGYGVTEENAKELKENGLFGVWVSLDHHTPEVHNKLRGHPEAFANACAAVENFKRAGVYTCLSLVPPDDLLEPDNFKKYYDFAKELGVAEIRVLEKKPSGREACRGVMSHSPVLEHLQKELFKDPAYREHPPLSGLSTWLEKDPALGCQCRFEYLFIASTGEVQPCEATEISFGNITQEPFPEIYKRACKAFPKPATGCIPMVMYPEVCDFQKIKDKLASYEKSEISTNIMRQFQERGSIPGAYKLIWSMYERRLSAYRNRLASNNQGVAR
jgi:MoaA/NifB/PqqE/SkfB family radical SAM enzyme